MSEASVRVGLRRAADPWHDTDVIDVYAARFAQGTTGVMALAGVILGWPVLWALMAAQLLVGLSLGRRWCIPCVFYYRVLQPRFGEGELEDSRPPRLANMMGFAFLSTAAIAWWAGIEPVGYVVAGLVACLALLSASTGFCAGCEIYRLVARLRGISPRHYDYIDPADLGLGAEPGPDRIHVEFTHSLCSDCRDWERRLGALAEPLIRIDVRERPDLARKYGVTIVPTVVAVGADGAVLERLA